MYYYDFKVLLLKKRKIPICFMALYWNSVTYIIIINICISERKCTSYIINNDSIELFIVIFRDGITGDSSVSVPNFKKMSTVL